MKLWKVYNGFMSFIPVHVLIVAKTKKRAIELATEAFKKDVADSKRLSDCERYWTGLTVEKIADDLTTEYTGYIQD